MLRNLRLKMNGFNFVLVLGIIFLGIGACSDNDKECWGERRVYRYHIPGEEIVIPVECSMANLFFAPDVSTQAEADSIINEIGATTVTIYDDLPVALVSNFSSAEFERAVLHDGIRYIHPCSSEFHRTLMFHSVIACFSGNIDSCIVDFIDKMVGYGCHATWVLDSFVVFDLEESKTCHPLQVVQESQNIEYIHWIEPNFIGRPVKKGGFEENVITKQL